MEILNVSQLISVQASKHPDKKSITEPKRIADEYTYQSYTFKQLDERINQFCHRLLDLGVKPRDKVLFFVKPNLDFCAITFALFRLGAVTVFIDPGMKKKYFFKCIQELKPDVIIGIPPVHILRRLFFWIFKGIRLAITTSNLTLFTPSLYKKLDQYPKDFKPYIPQENDLAAILFTSGGTGKPKGVEYSHDIFINQTKMLQTEFNLTHEDIDIPGFPLFSFFTLAMGMNSVIPDMNFAKPALCDPKLLYRNIQDAKATFVAGSPAIWERLAEYCFHNNLTLPSVKSMVMFGAPVSNRIHEYFAKILPNGTSFTPYGATECLPVSNISGEFILKHTAHSSAEGAGVCIGKPFAGVKVVVIEQTDKVIEKLQDAQILGVNQIGEIVVNSPNVTKGYYRMPQATALAKIYGDESQIWHRMGDVGYYDNDGQIWFCGRKKHVVNYNNQKFYPIPVEGIINKEKGVKRSALVLNKKLNEPAIVLELNEKTQFSEAFKLNLNSKIQSNPKTNFIKHIYVAKNFPVDTRHNIKIDREQLSREISK